MYVLLSALTLLVFVVALVDIIIRPQDQVKHLPKFLWIVIVIILPFVGSVIWFAVGREYTAANTPKAFTRRSAPGAPGSPRAQAQRSNPWPEPKTTEQELAELDREIEFYNKQAELKRLKSEAEGQPKAGE